MSKYIPNLTILKVVAGEPIQETVRQIQAAPQHIIVGTPGRVAHMLQNEIIDANNLKLFILDDADELLSHSLQDKVVEINDYVTKQAQTVLVRFRFILFVACYSSMFFILTSSCIMPKEIFDLTQQILTNPVRILVPREDLILDGLKQYYLAVEKEENKFDTLIELYESIAVSQVVIFVNSKQKAIQLQEDLARQNHTVSAIHGAMDIPERSQILRDFHDGRARILVNTNVLACGVSVQQLSLVINYDLPPEKESYIKRIGRAARFGRKGIAISFVTDEDAEMLQEIQKFYSTQIYELPSNIKELLM